MISLARTFSRKTRDMYKHRPMRSPPSFSFHVGLVNRFAEIIMNVPSMGDSITEGTIKTWEKAIGEAVKMDDVVVVIETDKVSVDIRAKDAGVLVEKYAEVDETVEVGAKLLKIDTTATPGAAVSVPVAEKVEAEPTTVNNATTTETQSPTHHRVPLIKFLGKRSLLPAATGHGHALDRISSPPSSVASLGNIKHTPGAKSFDELPPLFGRPQFSEAEIEAIESGGAL